MRCEVHEGLVPRMEVKRDVAVGQLYVGSSESGELDCGEMLLVRFRKEEGE